MQRQIVGRANERGRIGRWLVADTTGVESLSLTGPAGCGKTTLWEWTIGEATGIVLTSRASAADEHLPWVCLTDLLRAVPPGRIDALPPPQRHMLRVVLLLDDSDETVDERTVATAFWTLVEGMARDQPLLIAIDDVPRMDQASAAALSFAVRRMPDTTAVRIVTTARDDVPIGTAWTSIHPDRTTVVPVGPMSVAETFDLLDTHLGIRMPRPMLLRVHDTSAGSPLYALELARALQRAVTPIAPGRPLPVPERLDGLIGARIRAQPPAVRMIVAATAATRRLTNAGNDPGALDAATDAGLVVIDTDHDRTQVIRAAHPLIGAAAHASLTEPDRQTLHRRLAHLSIDPVERARHMALAGTGPDEAIATTLDAGVIAALAVGTPEIAVDLAHLAIAHTVGDALRADRLDRLAEALIRAGDPDGAVAARIAAVEATAAGPTRAVRQVRLAETMMVDAGDDGVLAILEAALGEAAGDPAATADVLITLAMFTLDINVARQHADRAVTLLDQIADPDPRVLVGALSTAVGMRFRAGHGLDRAGYERAIAIEHVRPRRRLADRADAGYAALLKYADEVGEAQVSFLTLLSEAEASGDLEAISYVLSHLPHIALWQGRLTEARTYAERHLALSVQAGMPTAAATARYNLGVAEAHLGRLDEATTLLNGTIEAATADAWDRQRGLGALGYVALSRGDNVLAADLLAEWHTLLRAMNFREPGYSRSHLDYVEALVATGRLDVAAEFLDELDDQVRTSGRRSAGAIALAGRALVAAGHGHIDAAADTIGTALAEYGASPFRIDRARARLIAGRILWRTRARRTARDHVTAAYDDFVAIGATVWSGHAATQLARMTFRSGASQQLTETEQRIAELAAGGMTNHAIAGVLFIATKTVEANLARAYRKLGIRSRAELGVRIGELP